MRAWRGTLIAISLIGAIAGEASGDTCTRKCATEDIDAFGCCPDRRQPLGADPQPTGVPPSARQPTSPVDPARAAARKEAERLAAEADKQNDADKFVACGQKYLDLYNADPEATDAGELLYGGAVCFQRGKSIGSAIHLYLLVLRYAPKSPLAARSLGRLGGVYGMIGFYDRAAEKLEEYARKYAGERDAADALIEATFYRRGLGADDKAIANTEFLARTWGAKQPQAVARQYFALTAVYEKHDADALVKHLTEYLRRYGTGEIEPALIARAKLASAQLRQACPAKAIDGLCIRATRERVVATSQPAKPRALARCGPAVSYQRIARTDRVVAEALTHVRGAIEMFDKHKDRIAADPQRFALARRQYGLARLAEVDLEFEADLAAPLASPDFSDDTARARSTDKLAAWTTARARQRAALAAKYEAIAATADPEVAVAAAARIGQLSQIDSDTLLGLPFTREVVAGTPAAARGEAYCTKLRELAAPIRKQAIDAFDRCLKASTTTNVYGEWTQVCQRERGRLDPATYPPAHELAAAPVVAAVPVELEPPGKQPPELAAVLAELRAVGVWTVPVCQRIGKKIEATASSDKVAVKYLAALAYHRCDLADAERAYREVLALNPKHGPTLSNLATIAFRRGKQADAKAGWEAAIAAHGKLVAARTNLVATQLAQLRRYPVGTADWKKLEEDLLFQLANVLGVEPDHVAAYTLFGLVYLEGHERNRNRLDLAKLLLDEALARDPKFAPAVNALGVYYERRRLTALALDRFQKAAALDPQGDGAVNLGLLLVKVRRHGDAAKQLATIKAPTYDVDVALGVALRGSGKLAEAQRAYEAAVKRDGKRAEAHFDLGVLFADHVGSVTTVRAVAVDAFTKAKGHFATAIARGLDPDAVARAEERIADLTRAIAAP